MTRVRNREPVSRCGTESNSEIASPTWAEGTETTMKKNDEGFTLIELLIVIVILGILAAVVVFAVGGITDRGQESACDADFKTLEVAYEAYIAQFGSSATPTETQLVNGDFLRQPSNLMNITSGGEVVIQDADCGTAGQPYVPN